LTTGAYELAGYAVATRVLGRRMPDKVVLKDDSEYDLGRCSERELDTIWAVGHMAGERSRNYGCSGEQGLIGISASMENRIADPMELNYPGAEVIVNEDWEAIVGVARLLTERGILLLLLNFLPLLAFVDSSAIGLDVVLFDHRPPELHLVRQELALHVRAANLQRDLHSLDAALDLGFAQVSANALLKRSTIARGVRPAVNEPHQA
jgi:hypothetical protein